MAINNIIRKIWAKKLEFFLVFVGVLTVSFGTLYAIDFLPEKPSSSEDLSEIEVVEVKTDHNNTTVPNQTPPLDPTPNKIIIDKLDREVAVLNPDSGSIADLDRALLNGVVRHPDSADFAHEGTMFLFGHSSHLPKVINKNFQAFNDIETLTWGDRIRVQSDNMEYIYRVDRVYEAKASAAEVEIVSGEAKLTLATCNSFGSKDDRHIVEATLVESHVIEGESA